MALVRPNLPSSVLKHVREHQAMQQAIRAALPAAMAEHVSYLNLRGGTLILGCDRQSLVTTLRFCAPQLLASVNALLPEPSALRVAWRTLDAPARLTPKTMQRQLSPHSIELVATTAKTIQDPALSAAMQKLAHAMRRKPLSTK
ncbi:MAG: DciA family protein [Halothiobacillaceae bacterium]